MLVRILRNIKESDVMEGGTDDLLYRAGELCRAYHPGNVITMVYTTDELDAWYLENKDIQVVEE